MSRLFDVYMAVDWSSTNSRSKARPSKDAIWVGERLAFGFRGYEDPGEAYFRTRMDCWKQLRGRLLRHASRGLRVFIGFDFAYGYPAGFSAALGLDGHLPLWRSVWEEISRNITDADNNINNRFEAAAVLNARCGGDRPGPFWGCPEKRQQPALSMRSPGFPYSVGRGLDLERLRITDRAQRGVQEVWKLYGAGSVGGQALVGIPVVRRLRDDVRFADFSSVWPFEAGFVSEPTPDRGPFILHAEIFPGNVPDPLDTDVIRDQAQIRAVVRWLSRLDEQGELARQFATPDGLTSESIEVCVKEEGWILGS
ncbi:MAG TPA: hypothetical protein VFJ72_08000 [Rubrobacteraceae bacterium]|nr:hypothetical protein [Rubrobacteraceae bacterium]